MIMKEHHGSSSIVYDDNVPSKGKLPSFEPYHVIPQGQFADVASSFDPEFLMRSRVPLILQYVIGPVPFGLGFFIDPHPWIDGVFHFGSRIRHAAEKVSPINIWDIVSSKKRKFCPRVLVSG